MIVARIPSLPGIFALTTETDVLKAFVTKTPAVIKRVAIAQWGLSWSWGIAPPLIPFDENGAEIPNVVGLQMPGEDLEVALKRNGMTRKEPA